MHKLKKKEYKYIVVLFLFLIIHKMIPYTTSNMEIVMLDVGQGDSTLIIYPHHKLTILVDTGGNMSVDMAKTIIIPTLRAYGISSLDALILSHGDYDHAGGALSLLEQFPVHQVFLNSGSNNALEEQLLHYLDSSKIAYKQVSEATWKIKGETLYFLNRRWEQNENQDSLVLFLPFRSYFFLMMGDSDQEVEEELLSRYALEADILKVGHHGSRTSSSLSFVEEVSPHICLISAGSGNRYGHPHTETLQNLKNCDTYLTSIVGAIRITIGSSMHVTTAR